MDTYIVNPVLVRMKESARGSIYQSIVALGFRARQINDDMKIEIRQRLEDVVETTETDAINFDQLAISKDFDRIPKPTFIAMKEIFEEKLRFELPQTIEEEIVP